MSRRGPAVVAELGRPETPQEEAARRAESSRNHRQRQTVNNLVYSLIATVAVAVVIVLAVPRSAPTAHTQVDWVKVAHQAQGVEKEPIAIPDLTSSWTSNQAQLRTDTPQGVDNWYVGFITPKRQFIAMVQGFSANPTWVAAQLHNSEKTGRTTVGGVQWTVYDNRHTASEVADVDYGMTATAGSSTFVLYGTADTAEFHRLAGALASDILADNAAAAKESHQ